jgi:hypothetical protein
MVIGLGSGEQHQAAAGFPAILAVASKPLARRAALLQDQFRIFCKISTSDPELQMSPQNSLLIQKLRN